MKIYMKLKKSGLNMLFNCLKFCLKVIKPALMVLKLHKRMQLLFPGNTFIGKRLPGFIFPLVSFFYQL